MANNVVQSKLHVEKREISHKNHAYFDINMKKNDRRSLPIIHEREHFKFVHLCAPHATTATMSNGGEKSLESSSFDGQSCMVARFYDKTCSTDRHKNDFMIEKVRVIFYLDKDVVQKFRELIALKYKTVERGLLSWEAQQALVHWIALHTNAQNSKDFSSCLKPNPTPRVAQVFRQVKAYLLRNYYEELPAGYQIPAKHLREAIAAVRGSDPRTIKKWMKAFADFHLIKHITGELWEIAA